MKNINKNAVSVILGVLLLTAIGAGTMVYLMQTTLASTKTAVPATQQDIVGVWQDGYGYWYEFDEDGTWYEYGERGETRLGYYEVADSSVTMYLPDGTWQDQWQSVRGGFVSAYDSTNWLDTSTLPEFPETNTVKSGAAGIWQYTNKKAWVLIYPGGTWDVYTPDSWWSSGYNELSEDGTTLNLLEMTDSGDVYVALMVSALDENTLVDQNGLTLQRQDKIELGSYDLPAEVMGVWQQDDLWYEFTEDGTWSIYNSSGLVLDGPFNYYGEDEISLCIGDTSEFMTWPLDNPDAERSTLPDFGTSAIEQLGADGTWLCMMDGSWLLLYPGGSWVMYSEFCYMTAGIARVTDDGSILLLLGADDDDADAWTTLTVSDDGTMTTDAGYLLMRDEMPSAAAMTGGLGRFTGFTGLLEQAELADILTQAGQAVPAGHTIPADSSAASSEISEQ